MQNGQSERGADTRRRTRVRREVKFVRSKKTKEKKIDLFDFRLNIKDRKYMYKVNYYVK